MKLIEKVKSHTSKWIKTKGHKYHKFYWQNGYGGFSVHGAQTHVVKNYISTQDVHHAKKTFQEEYRNFLDEFNITYNEDYVWD
jgi:hypothetical protein